LLEFLIIRLKIKTPEIKLFFISAVMHPLNAKEYSLWLSNNEKNVLRSLKFNDSPIEDEWEPTRKLISSFRWEGNRGNILFQNVTTGDGNDKNSKGAVLYSYLKEKEFGNRYPRKKNKFETAASLAFKMSEDGNTLVFCAQVQRIKTVAKSLKALFSVIEVPKRFLYFNQKKSSFYASLWYGNESYITEAIDHGIGIHFGDMPEQVRNAVEEDFRKGLLSILLSTNTIGQGLNFPIKNIIFYETQISRVEKQNIYIQNRDFWNIIGRAG
ncbi:helicase-related protein, partial [Leptospira bourretii]|uniref:helicase-related protein n=1 Tax=Leptospira bourretii TaxID=2484962 RepID=UPI001090F34F